MVILSHRLRSKPQMVLEALASALNQTEPDIEIRLAFMEENRPTKLNDAVTGTCGEWVSILCDDDLYAPRFVEKGMHVAAACPDVGVIYTDRRVFRDSEPPDAGYHFRMHGTELSGPQPYRMHITPGSFVFGMSLPMTMLIRRDWWDKLHGHDPLMPHSDTELWYRLSNAGARFAYIPEPLFYYREHVGQMCRQVNTMPDALRVFHRKHFPAFGIAFLPSRGYEVPGRAIPIGDRLAYESAYLTPLTTAGYMALEMHDLRKSARALVELKQREAQQAVQAVIMLVLLEEGLDPEDGWKLNTDYRAVREMPDPPADLSIPATLVHDHPTGNLTLVGDQISGEGIAPELAIS